MDKYLERGRRTLQKPNKEQWRSTNIADSRKNVQNLRRENLLSRRKLGDNHSRQYV